MSEIRFHRSMITHPIDAVGVQGVDMIRWEDAGRIVDYEMVQPLETIHALHERMSELLACLEQPARATG